MLTLAVELEAAGHHDLVEALFQTRLAEICCAPQTESALLTLVASQWLLAAKLAHCEHSKTARTLWSYRAELKLQQARHLAARDVKVSILPLPSSASPKELLGCYNQLSKQLNAQ